MKVLYFDCFSGISGDMTISSLIDHGIDKDEFIDALKQIKIDGYNVKFDKTKRNQISANTFKVDYEDHHHHRTMNDISEIITNSDLSDEVKKMSLKIFENLAIAEGKIHDLSPDAVYFHEVGAVDSIIDIVGTSILINLIKPEKIIFSKIPIGSGFVKSQHGIIPVPAPATLELLKDIPVYDNGFEGELVTPTGAAIVKTLGDEYGTLSNIKIKSIGYGAGTKEYDVPNILRTIVGEIELKKKVEFLKVLETNVDDMNPEFYQYIIGELFKHGALDVYISPIFMKKERPANMLSVLCESNYVDGLMKIIFKETTTFGIRTYDVERYKLSRDFITVQTSFGPVRVKRGYYNGKLIKASPEYEDIKSLAKKTGKSINTIYNSVISHINL